MYFGLENRLIFCYYNRTSYYIASYAVIGTQTLMIITWYGEGCFKIQSGQLTIALDSLHDDSGLTAPRFKPNIAIQTETPYPIPYETGREFDSVLGPGEYEIQGVAISGFADGENAATAKTIYTVVLEDIKIGILGGLTEPLRPDAQEGLAGSEILIVPAGDEPHISIEAVAKIIKQINPRIIIPAFFKIKDLKRKAGTIEEFVKEIGRESSKEEKLVIKKKDLPEHPRIVVLTI
ncbi:MAG: MBL fold metallo-hydrolase [Patescibacteria group bacterium]